MGLIDKEQASRELFEFYHGAISDSELKIYQVLRFLDRQPTIDAVSVVRCKDCKYCQHDYLSKRYSCFKPLGFWVRAMIKPTDFCSYGERKGE